LYPEASALRRSALRWWIGAQGERVLVDQALAGILEPHIDEHAIDF